MLSNLPYSAHCVPQVLRLWEAVWAAPQPHFHMWVVLAVLQHHRKPLMEAATDYDGLLKYCIQVCPVCPITPCHACRGCARNWTPGVASMLLEGLESTLSLSAGVASAVNSCEACSRKHSCPRR